MYEFKDVEFDVHPNHPVENLIGNVKTNLKLNIPRFRIKKAVLVAGGPSINDYVEDIKKEDGDIIAMNGSAKWLRKHGIKPSFHVLMDGRPGVEDYVEGDPSITYMICSQCDPKVFKAAKDCNRLMWHAAGVDEMQQTLKDLEPGSNLICGGGTVGLRSLYLMFLQGYHHFTLYGYDSSNREEKHGYPQPMNEGQPTYDFKFNDKVFNASGPMAAQANEFVIIAKKLMSYGVSIEVKGDGLLPEIWKYHCDLRLSSSEAREAEKYRQIWNVPGYRVYSPGEQLVNEAFGLLDMKGKVIDFGCGSGRALKAFQEKGLEVLGVDIAVNCLNPDINVPLCISPLWSLPDIKGDFGFCTDVMEHIPPEYVDDVLRGIKKSVSKVYFQIATIPDGFGDLIGERLHLTVKPTKWWLETLGKYWDVSLVRDEGTTFSCIGV